MNSLRKNSIFLIPLVALFTFVMVFSSYEVHADDHSKSVADKLRENNDNTDEDTAENNGDSTDDNSNENNGDDTDDNSSENNGDGTGDKRSNEGNGDGTPILGDDKSAGKNIFILLIQLIFYTALVVFMIYGLIKFLSVRQKKLQRNNVFNVISGVSVGNQKSLQLVQAGNKMYVIGVGDNVTLLKEIDDENEIASLQADIDAKEVSPLATGIERLFKKSEDNPTNESRKSELNTFQTLMKATMEKQKQKRTKLEYELQNRNKEDEEQ